MSICMSIKRALSDLTERHSKALCSKKKKINVIQKKNSLHNNLCKANKVHFPVIIKHAESGELRACAKHQRDAQSKPRAGGLCDLN